MLPRLSWVCILVGRFYNLPRRRSVGYRPIGEGTRLAKIGGFGGKGVRITSHCAGLLVHVAAQRMKALAHAATHSVHVSFPTRLAQPSSGSCGTVRCVGMAMIADKRERKGRRFQARMVA